MSTSDNKTGAPAETNSEATNDSSERAKAIARRSFLRKSASIAAPVVMTLQSGPALAIRSITCQDKTGDLDLSNESGFTDEPTLVAGNTITTNPVDLVDLDPNDGFVRCPATGHAVSDIAPFPDTTENFTETTDVPPEWSFNGPDGIFDGNTATTETGPIAYFSIIDGEETFEGCYGEPSMPQNGIDPNTGEPFRALTCSCWSSLNP